MALWRGSFDSRRDPILKIHVSSGPDISTGLEVEGIIDTGYTGFVLLPAQFVVSLGLRVQGTTTVTLADDSPCPCLIAEAHVWLDGQTSRRGIVTLEPKCKEILIGMDFLRQFGLALVVTSKAVSLFDEQWLDRLTSSASGT